MNNKIKEQLSEQLQQDARFLANIVKMQAIVKELGLEDLEACVSIQSYSFSDDDPPRINISPLHQPGIAMFMEPDIERAIPSVDDPTKMVATILPVLRVVDATPILSQIARHILPKVGKLKKGFDEQYNKVTLTTIYQGIKIVIDATPKTCSVERIEQEVDVPEAIIPAHKEKKVSYRLIGDCDPILADEAAHVLTSQGAIELE